MVLKTDIKMAKIIVEDVFYFLIPFALFFIAIVEEYMGNMSLVYKTIITLISCFVLGIVYCEGLFGMKG
jgi:hypothetical protein